MTLIYQRKKATVVTELPPGEVAELVLVSSTPVNGGNQTLNFTDALNDHFLVFYVNSASSVPTLSINGTPTAALQSLVGQHSYNTGIWIHKAVGANVSFALGSAGVGSWVVHRVRGRDAPINVTLRTFGLGSAAGATGGLTSIAGAGSLVILWDRDVELNVQPVVSTGTRLHNYRYQYFQGLLQFVPGASGTVPAMSFTNMVNTYGFFYCQMLVNPA